LAWYGAIGFTPLLSPYPPKLLFLPIEPCDIVLFEKLYDTFDCCDALGGGGVAAGVDATDCAALKDPIWGCDDDKPLLGPMLSRENGIEGFSCEL
jgi:hypothetical protein